MTWYHHVLFTSFVKLAGENKHAYNARGERGRDFSSRF